MKLLITSTSFQDTPGKHKQEIENYGFEIDNLRGPLTEDDLLPIIDKYDYIICGDDEYSKKVLEKGKKNRLKVLSKYGIGLDKIDLNTAKELDVKVFNTPNINSEAVAEHVFALLLSFEKNIIKEDKFVQDNRWKRLIGHEIYNKNILVMGLGSVGKEVCKRANAFGMKVYGFDIVTDEKFINDNNIHYTDDFKKVINDADYISLNIPLNNNTKQIINTEVLNLCKHDVVIINTARGKLIQLKALQEFLINGKIRGYLTDVLEKEPMILDHPLLNFENVIITPHIGSRNYETVERQGLKAVENLINYINIL